ncbi:hypothetical protein ERX46_09040 [Brumimicrobium glaciale]|uniref:Outer membrane protein beta-barrel domain-containing protein n=1 Tax=Brumimicrobium glaciale TaxID=200475 RepID=A0A4Q4KNS9_9FLAO|nr:hypothetical protein [Brumimicrobium glaciale]RYM34094.1 hypothetical protein ERX46_09040 [Brumimicrobium glaciale]
MKKSAFEPLLFLLKTDKLINLKKSTLLSIFLLFGITLNAQVAFYLRPTIIAKTNQGKFGSFSGKASFNTITNEHFTFANQPVLFSGYLDIGFNIGIQIKEKHFIELGLSSDYSSIGNNILINSTYTDFQTGKEYITNNYSMGTTSIYYPRLSVDYHNNFWSNPKETLRIRSVAGVGVLIGGKSIASNGGDSPDQPNSPEDYREIGPNIFITNEYSTSTNNGGNTAYFKLGFGMDFNTKKDRHLFSLDASYLLSARPVQYEETRIHVLDNGNEVNYLFDQSSRGSGFYFQISRKFQVYPWIPIRKDKI